MLLNNRINSIFATLFILFSSSVFSAESMLCPDAEMFDGSIATDICWTCMLPVRIFGSDLINNDNAPDDAHDEPLCNCMDTSTLNWKLGFTAGLMLPSKIVETVRVPFCSPFLGGIILGESDYEVDPAEAPVPDGAQGPSTPSNNTTLLETVGTRSPWGYDDTDITRYHQHVFSFPILYIMKVLTEFACLPGGFSSVDMAFAPTEFIPTWSVDELAALTQPHAALFSHPAVQMTCAYDAYQSTFGKPSNQMYCNGGDLLFPLHGNITDPIDALRSESITTARNLELNHELGLARISYGEDAMCGSAPLAFSRPKQQYKVNLMYPVPEASGDCCHYEGAYTPTWGAGKVLPGPGENFVKMMYQWVDCCVNLL